VVDQTAEEHYPSLLTQAEAIHLNRFLDSIIELADGRYAGAGNKSLDFRGKPLAGRRDAGAIEAD
jgi:hypothetical protein